MSASILNPVAFSEFYKIRSPTTMARQNFNVKKMDKIKRDLFGPADPFEISKIFEDEIQKQQDTASKKWGFDFRDGHPLTKSDYIWERVPFSDLVPTMYTLSRAAHVREITSHKFDESTSISSTDLLMDERSNRENSTEIHLSSSGSDDLFKIPIADCLMTCSASAGKRQPKITEYMNKRKRLSATPKKLQPPKRLRSNSSVTGHYSLFGSQSTNKSHKNNI